MKTKPSKEKRMRVYIDVGSHGGVFMFEGGKIADRYPTLLHVYRKKLANYMKPAVLVYKI